MIVTCPKCGNLVSDKATVCPSCGASIKIDTPTQQPTKEETSSEKPEMASAKPVEAPVSQGWNTEDPKKKNGIGMIILSVVLTVTILCVGGIFLYLNVIKPRQIDKAAPRYYTFAPSVVLRSSKNSGADFNKIGSLPYGTELITYDYDYEWSEVKVNSLNAEGKKVKGFIASPFILEKTDFFLLNSIFGDNDSKDVVETSKCRRALLNYFKEHGYIGRLSPEETVELGLPYPSDENQWQIFCLSKDMPTNNVYFKRLLRKDSKFTDFAIIIKNINSGERKLLFFYFDDDETPHLAAEQDAPEYGTIKKVYTKTISGENYLMVDYTD